MTVWAIGDLTGARAFLAEMAEHYRGIAPVLGLARLMEEQEGVGPARAYLGRQLKDRPSVRGESALIDLTGLYTVNALGGTARATADLRVDFHRPATSGPLRAIGSVVKPGKHLSVAETRIEDSAQRLLASGRGAYV